VIPVGASLLAMPFRAPRLSRPNALSLTTFAGESSPALIACLANPWWNNQRSLDDNLDDLPSKQLIAIHVSRWL
jgi:hypothetical protein